MTAIEQSITGNIYNKAEYWGLLGGKNHGERASETAPMPDPHACSVDVMDRVFLYTKSSDMDNLLSMINGTSDIVRTMIPWPFDYMKKLGTFEVGLSDITSSLFMIQNQQSYTKLAKLEWDSEQKNREDLVKSGFRQKRFKVPQWIV